MNTMLWEFSNINNVAQFQTEISDLFTAAIVTYILGDGKFSSTPINHNTKHIPNLNENSLDSWFQEQFNCTFYEAMSQCDDQKIIETLVSFQELNPENPISKKAEKIAKRIYELSEKEERVLH